MLLFTSYFTLFTCFHPHRIFQKENNNETNNPSQNKKEDIKFEEQEKNPYIKILKMHVQENVNFFEQNMDDIYNFLTSIFIINASVYENLFDAVSNVNSVFYDGYIQKIEYTGKEHTNQPKIHSPSEKFLDEISILFESIRDKMENLFETEKNKIMDNANTIINAEIKKIVKAFYDIVKQEDVSIFDINESMANIPLLISIQFEGHVDSCSKKYLGIYHEMNEHMDIYFTKYIHHVVSPREEKSIVKRFRGFKQETDYNSYVVLGLIKDVFELLKNEVVIFVYEVIDFMANETIKVLTQDLIDTKETNPSTSNNYIDEKLVRLSKHKNNIKEITPENNINENIEETENEFEMFDDMFAIRNDFFQKKYSSLLRGFKNN